MPWARLDDMLPVHPKVRGLSDSAFRLYVSAICWSNCNQTDGHIPSAQLQYVSDVRRARYCADQLVQAGLWETDEGGWRIHDYLEYQPSSAKVKHERELKRQRQERWRAGVDASPLKAVDASQDASTDASSRARTHPIPSRSGSVGNQSAGRHARPPDLILIETVKEAMTSRGYSHIADQQAMHIAAQILGSESVRNPAAYIAAAISRDPQPSRFLPTPSPPPYQPPNGRPVVPSEDVAGLLAQTRRAITKEVPDA